MWRWPALPAPSDVPVDPSAAEAREWAADELSKGVYQSQQGITRILDRIGQFFSDLFQGILTRDDPWAILLLVLGLSAVLILAVVGASRLRRNTRAAGGQALVFDDARSAQQLREDARRALAAGDTARAFLDGYRAIIRSLDERAVLDDRAGMTAHEAAVAASPAFPAQANGLAWASTVFDAAYYGRRAVNTSEVERLFSLDAAIAGARPVRHEPEYAG